MILSTRRALEEVGMKRPCGSDWRSIPWSLAGFRRCHRTKTSASLHRSLRTASSSPQDSLFPYHSGMMLIFLMRWSLSGRPVRSPCRTPRSWDIPRAKGPLDSFTRLVDRSADVACWHFLPNRMRQGGQCCDGNQSKRGGSQPVGAESNLRHAPRVRAMPTAGRAGRPPACSPPRQPDRT
jgi:hypothetical protein